MAIVEEARFYVGGECLGSYRQAPDEDRDDYEDEVQRAAAYISRENHGAQVVIMRTREDRK